MRRANRREHGEGSIDERSPGNFRLRYRIRGTRHSVTFKGSRGEAKAKLRELLRSGDTGEHVAPDRLTFADWANLWISLGAPGRRKRPAGARAVERYESLIRVHVLPELGAKRLQQLTSTDIDRVYTKIATRIAPRTQRHVHSCLNASLTAAVRIGKITANPMERVERIPSAPESDRAQVLDEAQLTTLVQGFRKSTLFPIVAIAAFCGARRNEILSLRWTDFDPVAKTLRIERAIDITKAGGRTIKPPKTSRGIRTIAIDESLTALLVAQRAQHLRLVAGVPDATDVDLRLVKLPPHALMFPSFAVGDVNLTKLRDPKAVSREFARQARSRGFAQLRFHDLRHSHETVLLDKGIPIHVVAARCGHDPAVLLRTYAQRTKKADAAAADVIGAISKGALA